MGELQHTPGPWHVEDPLGDDAGDALWIVRNGVTPHVYDWRCVAIVTSDDPDETDNPLPVSAVERNANARLIAAAPDLLEALTIFKERVERFGDWDDGCFYFNGRAAPELEEPLRLARAAIAKATTPNTRMEAGEEGVGV